MLDQPLPWPNGDQPHYAQFLFGSSGSATPADHVSSTAVPAVRRLGSSSATSADHRHAARPPAASLDYCARVVLNYHQFGSGPAAAAELARLGHTPAFLHFNGPKPSDRAPLPWVGGARGTPQGWNLFLVPDDYVAASAASSAAQPAAAASTAATTASTAAVAAAPSATLAATATATAAATAPPPPSPPPPPPPSPPPHPLTEDDIAVGVHCGGSGSGVGAALDALHASWGHRFRRASYFGDAPLVSPRWHVPLRPWPRRFLCATEGSRWGDNLWRDQVRCLAQPCLPRACHSCRARHMPFVPACPCLCAMPATPEEQTPLIICSQDRNPNGNASKWDRCVQLRFVYALLETRRLRTPLCMGLDSSTSRHASR